MWSYADARDVLAPYNNIDMKLSASWSHYGVTLEVNDLLDVQYEHIPRYPMPGRTWKVTVSFSL